MNQSIYFRTSLLLAILACAFTTLLSAAEEVISFAGNWSIHMSVNTEAAAPCVFEGTAQINQKGSVLTGEVDVKRVSGPIESCPAAMNATLTGTAEGSSVEGTLDGGQAFGSASFIGTLSETAQGASLQIKADNVEVAGSANSSSVLGSSMALQGPYSGLSLSFMATQVQMVDIPTFSEFGIVALTALLLSATLLLLRRSVI